jgi:hypothetical protein
MEQRFHHAESIGHRARNPRILSADKGIGDWHKSESSIRQIFTAIALTFASLVRLCWCEF